MPDEVENALSAYLTNNGALLVESYVKRGRPLQAEDTASLKERWVFAFKEWARNWRQEKDRRAREDIESELALRREELPYGAVQAEKEALIDQAKLLYKELQKHPKRMKEINDGLVDDLIAFYDDAQAKMQ
jgi:hypothetical protein